MPPEESQLWDPPLVADVSIKMTNGKKYDHTLWLIKTFSINEPQVLHVI